MNLESAKSAARQLIRSGLLSREAAQENLQAYAQRERGGDAAGGTLLDFLVERAVLTRAQAELAASEFAASESGAGDASSGNGAGANQAPPDVPGYKIEELIGAGSMGRVYRARQLSMDRDVAIKFLPAQLARNKAFAKSFIQEARTVARLSHLNIVTGIDVGEHQGSYYFVMEFLEGDTVGDELRRGKPIDERRAIDIVRQIAAALEHARESGLVHRDVKPDNILMTSEGIPKLGDLGLAFHEDSDQPTRLAGTPQYIAPEAVRRQPVDSRSDIYSLGVSLLHMLSGRPPFTGTPAEVIEKHVKEGIPDLRDVMPQATARTAALVAGMTAMDPAHRYQTPAEVAEAAAVYLDHPGRSIPRPAGMPAPASGRRGALRPGRRSYGGLVASIAAIAGALGLYYLIDQREPIAPTSTGIPHEVATGTPPPGAPENPKPTRVPVALTASAQDQEIEAARTFEEARIYFEAHPADFVGATQRMHAVEELYGATSYAAKARESMAAIEAERQSAAGHEFERVTGEAARRRAEDRLDLALAALKGFAPAFSDTEPGRRAADALRELETELRTAVATGIARALALAKPAADAAPDFDGARKELESLRAIASDKDKGNLQEASAEVDRLQSARLAQQRTEIATQMAQAATQVALADKQLEELLAKLDLVAALEMYEALAADAGVQATPALATQVQTNLARITQLRAVESRIRADLATRDGSKLTYDGKRATVAVGAAGELHARVGTEDSPIELAKVEAPVLLAGATKDVGAKAGTELLYASEFLLYAGALDEAAQCLEMATRAGASAGLVAALTARLQSARAAMREVAALALWEEASQEMRPGRWKTAAKLLKQLLTDWADTEYVKEHQFEIQDAFDIADNGGEPPPLIAKILKGKVKILKSPAGQPLSIEVTYDFELPEQLEDFDPMSFGLPDLGGPGGGGGGGGGGAAAAAPDANEWKVTGGHLQGKGREQLAWKPVVTGDLVLQYEFTTPRHSNIGMNLYRNADQYYLFCLGFDLFGDNRVGRALGSSRNIMMKVDPAAMANYDGPPWQAWAQSIKDQSSKPEIASNRPYLVQVAVKGESVMMVVGKTSKLAAKDESFRKGQVSWFCVGNELEVDDLKIVARIDPKWLADAEEAYRKKEDERRRAGSGPSSPEPPSGPSPLSPPKTTDKPEEDPGDDPGAGGTKPEEDAGG